MCQCGFGGVNMSVKDELLDIVDHEWILDTVLEDCEKLNDNGDRIRMRCYCEDHNDSNASAYYYIKDGTYHCYGCDHHASYINIVMERMCVTFKEAIKLIKEKSGVEYKSSEPVDTDEKVTNDDMSKWNSDLLGNKANLEALEKYGISKNIAIRFKLGFTRDNRIIIPNTREGKIISVKHHSIVPSNTKSFFVYGKTALYPIRNIRLNDKLLFVEGEPDCLSLYSLGVDSYVTPCCGTGGAQRFSKLWSEYFKGKIVYVSLDNDEAGEKGLGKFVNSIFGIADKIYLVKIPCKDMRDYIVKMGATKQDVIDRIKEATEYTESHPFYIKTHVYPLIEEALGKNRFTFSALKAEMDKYFTYGGDK